MHRSDCPSTDQLTRLLADQVSAAEFSDLEQHVETCPPCQEILAGLVAAVGLPVGVRPAGRPEPAGLGETFARRLKCADSGTDHAQSLATVGWGLRPVAAAGEAPQVAGYEILGELGRGGMGVVYRARQLSLNRPVALKMILAGAHAGPRERARFRAEALAVAQLHHPNITQIYEIGEHGGHLFFSLELVEGGSLAEHLHGRPQDPAAAARLVETLARALHYAHLQGIVHRDLKPANVLLTPDGVPKITDFGLAKRLRPDGAEGGPAPEPTTNALVGTPGYAAPEQLDPSRVPVGPAADVYALGGVLYEALTGVRPFRAPTLMETLVQVLHRPPVPPRRVRPGVPADLETIALKCLEKEVTRRYASALEVAEECAAFLRGEPIKARPAGPLEKARKWARRRPAVAALLAVVLFVFLGGFGLVSWQWYEADSARAQADDNARKEGKARQEADSARAQADDNAREEKKARREAEDQRWQAQYLSAGLTLDQGIQHCREGQVAPGMLWMARALELLPPGKSPEQSDRTADLDFAIRTNLSAWRGRLCPVRHGPGRGTPVTAVAFAPDGKTILTGDWGNANGQRLPARAELWDAATWRPRLKQPVRHRLAILGAAFRPDGKTFATASLDGTARLWEVATGRPAGPPLPHRGPVVALAFRPDGKALATLSLATVLDPAKGPVPGSVVQLWDPDTGRPQGQAVALGGVLLKALAWDPAGKLVAVAGAREMVDRPGADKQEVGGVLAVLDVAGRRVRGQPLLFAEPVNAVAFHPDGKVLAVGGDDCYVRLLDARTLRRLPGLLHHAYPVRALAYSKDGRLLATGGGLRRGPRWGPGEARLWDTTTGQPLLPPLVHDELYQENTVHAVALSPDGLSLATASENGHACLWDVGAVARPRIIPPGAGPAASAIPSFTPDGRTLLIRHGRDPDKKSGAGACTDIRVLALAPAGGPDARLPKPEAVFRVPGYVTVVPSPDSARLATFGGGDESPLRLWRTAKGKAAGPAALARGVSCAAFSADGKLLAAGDRQGRVRLWDAATLAPLGRPLKHQGGVRQVAFSADGRRLVVLTAPGALHLWTVPEGRPVGPPLTVPDRGPYQARFTRDGRAVLTAWAGFWFVPSLLTLTDTADGRLLRKSKEVVGMGAIQGLLSPDGRSFLTMRNGGEGAGIQARLWDATTLEPLAAPVPLSHTEAAFHPSGRYLALVTPEGDVNLWLPRLGKSLGPPLLLRDPVSAVVAFHPGGGLLATGTRGGAVQLWKLPRPVAGPPAQVKLLVEALRGEELDEAGAVRVLPPAEAKARRARLTISWPR